VELVEAAAQGVVAGLADVDDPAVKYVHPAYGRQLGVQ
jgi:hypothetical protein